MLTIEIIDDAGTDAVRWIGWNITGGFAYISMRSLLGGISGIN